MQAIKISQLKEAANDCKIARDEAETEVTVLTEQVNRIRSMAPIEVKSEFKLTKQTAIRDANRTLEAKKVRPSHIFPLVAG